MSEYRFSILKIIMYYGFLVLFVPLAICLYVGNMAGVTLLGFGIWGGLVFTAFDIRHFYDNVWWAPISKHVIRYRIIEPDDYDSINYIIRECRNNNIEVFYRFGDRNDEDRGNAVDFIFKKYSEQIKFALYFSEEMG